MPRISTISLTHLPERPALVIRSTVPQKRLPAFIGQSFVELTKCMGKQNEFPADIPYVRFDNEDPDALQVEIGIQTARQLEGNGIVTSITIPEATYAFCMYQGPFGEAQVPAYHELKQWIDENKLTAAGPIIEQYYNGQEVSEDLYLTKLSIQVKR